jgi:outer membrane autotransporter protein
MLGVSWRVLGGAAAAILWCGTVFGQGFVSQGPGPRFGPVNGVQSGDATPNGTAAGAIQALLPDPALGANTYFAGSTNGGVWVTNNSGATWTPLTDKQASLSVGSLSLDPTDRSGKTIVAGIGVTANGDWDQFNTLFQGRGGQQTGLLYTTNGGASWSALGGAALQGQSVIGTAARGNTILAATFEETIGSTATTQTSTGAQYGLYRSTNGGASFALVSGSSGLGSGPVTSLVADPANPSRFYAAVTSVATPNQTSVYVSNDTGATWAPAFTAANSNGTIGNTNQSVIGLASGPNGSVALTVSTMDASTGRGALSGVFLSQDGGGTWHQLTGAPNVLQQGQTPVNLHIAIDPNNANIVYLTGDYYTSCTSNPPGSACTVQAWRVAYNPADGSSASTSLTFEGTSANSFSDANTAHGASRALAFTPAGALIMASDGGIYQRSNPQGAGTWIGLNGNLSGFEPYAIAFDANSKRLAIAAQDNGTSLQAAPGSSVFNPINTGAGTNVAINDRTLFGLSAIYSSAQNLGFLNRTIIDAQGNTVTSVKLTCNGGNDCGQTVSAGFLSPIVLNRNDPTRIAMGGLSDVFVTQDLLSVSTFGSDDLALTDAGNVGGPTTIAYGTRSNASALLVGGYGGVFVSSTATAGSLANLPNYAGMVPTNVLFDPRTQQRFFVADSNDLWGVTNGTAAAGSVAFNRLTANLPAGFVRPTSLEFISNNGVNALLVGGLNTPLSCSSAPNGCVIADNQSPITVADSDLNGTLSNWRAFGQNLPNALVSALSYNPTVDVLSAALVGRGAWVLYDATSYFPQATVLQFGLANNDSAPDASLLTDGTAGSRPLIKYGTGTLLINGVATYTGGTTIQDGTLQLGTGITSGSILGNVTFCSSFTDPSCNATTSKFLIFDEPSAYAFNGVISGPGQIIQEGNGTVTLTADSSGFSGSTLVTGGGLVIGPDSSPNAALGDSVTVQNGAVLSGHGTIGGSLFNPSGVVASLGAAVPLKAGGDYVQGAAGTLLVGLSPAAAAKLSVAGTATLAGTLTLQSEQTQRYVPFSRFAILTADNGITGTFGQLNGTFPVLPLTVQYAPNEVDLVLGGFSGANANQQAVASALNAAFPFAAGDFASVLDTVVNLPPAQMQQALSSFGGQIYADLAEVSLQNRRLFLGAMDQRLRLASADSPSAAVLGSLPGGSLRAPWGGGANATQLAALAAAVDDASGDFIPDPVGLRVAAGEAQARAPASGNVWARGFGQIGSINDNAGAFGSNYSSGGGAIGADVVKSVDHLLGIALGGGRSSVSLNTNPETATISYFELGLYGAQALGAGFQLDGAGVFSHNYYDASRGVVFAGARRTATSSHSGDDQVVDVGLSWPYVAGGWDVTPRLGLSYYHIGQSTFSESGAGSLDLTVDPHPLNALLSRMGIAIANPMVIGNTAIVPEIRAAWFHNFLDQQGQSSAAFIGSSNFTQTGAPVGSNGVDLGLGLSFSLAQTLFPAQASGFLQYDATLASHEMLNTFAGGVRMKW